MAYICRGHIFAKGIYLQRACAALCSEAGWYTSISHHPSLERTGDGLYVVLINDGGMPLLTVQGQCEPFQGAVLNFNLDAVHRYRLQKGRALPNNLLQVGSTATPYVQGTTFCNMTLGITSCSTLSPTSCENSVRVLNRTSPTLAACTEHALTTMQQREPEHCHPWQQHAASGP